MPLHRLTTRNSVIWDRLTKFGTIINALTFYVWMEATVQRP